MLTVNCIGTGSLGNMFVLDHDGEKLILEIGMPYKNLLLAIDDVQKIAGCIVSHEHKDHLNPKTFSQLNKLGVKFITPKNSKIGKLYKLGSFEVVPLPAVHNVECRAFLIRVGGDSVLFATDTRQLPKLNNIEIDFFMVEVNYIEQKREQAVLADPDSNTLHLSGIYQNHHSLESAVEYFESLSYNPKAIITVHKSNSGLFDEQEVLDCLGCFADVVAVADKGSRFIFEEI